MSEKKWVHRENKKAENLLINQVEDPYRPGELRVHLSYRTEGTKLVKVDHIEAYMDVWQVARLVEESRKIMDNQIIRMQQLRNRLGFG